MRRSTIVVGVCVLAAGCSADQWERFPGPDDVIGLVPWFSTMKQGLAVQPYKWPVPRPPVEGTVPVQGSEPALRISPATLPTIDALRNPIENTAVSLDRGKDRYDIFCLPCHGADGDGQGPVNAVLRASPSLLTDRARGLSDGYLYTYIRFGGPIMPPYGARIFADDRWHVVNYVRLLQGASR